MPGAGRTWSLSSLRLGQTGEARDDEEGEHVTDDCVNGEVDDLPAVQPLALRVVEEVGEFLVQLHDRQQIIEAGSKAPEPPLTLSPLRRRWQRREEPQDDEAKCGEKRNPHQDKK